MFSDLSSDLEDDSAELMTQAETLEEQRADDPTSNQTSGAAVGGGAVVPFQAQLNLTEMLEAFLLKDFPQVDLRSKQLNTFWEFDIKQYGITSLASLPGDTMHSLGSSSFSESLEVTKNLSRASTRQKLVKAKGQTLSSIRVPASRRTAAVPFRKLKEAEMLSRPNLRDLNQTMVDSVAGPLVDDTDYRDSSLAKNNLLPLEYLKRIKAAKKEETATQREQEDLEKSRLGKLYAESRCGVNAQVAFSQSPYLVHKYRFMATSPRRSDSKPLKGRKNHVPVAFAPASVGFGFNTATNGNYVLQVNQHRREVESKYKRPSPIKPPEAKPDNWLVRPRIEDEDGSLDIPKLLPLLHPSSPRSIPYELSGDNEYNDVLFTQSQIKSQRQIPDATVDYDAFGRIVPCRHRAALTSRPSGSRIANAPHHLPQTYRASKEKIADELAAIKRVTAPENHAPITHVTYLQTQEENIRQNRLMSNLARTKEHFADRLEANEVVKTVAPYPFGIEQVISFSECTLNGLEKKDGLVLKLTGLHPSLTSKKIKRLFDESVRVIAVTPKLDRDSGNLIAYVQYRRPGMNERASRLRQMISQRLPKVKKVKIQERPEISIPFRICNAATK
mmetsp:Transcript_13136/g.25462  ORF Transcript_13136/g.25462 Transcript_13136/m.25462 type:complete len:615 (+) Transcript_13136:2518-4362(+)